jgi:uncharacterized protein
VQGYRAPRWLPGGNLQTLWAATAARRHAMAGGTPDTPGGPALPPRFARERWATPDGDFIEVDHLCPMAADPPRHLVLFHGLEGSSRSHYAQAFADVARQRGWAYSVPHFRGCGGELNLGPRAYHSGDYEEIGWILQRLRARSRAPLLVVGVSLGGNALLRWAQEAGHGASATAACVAAVSSPVDLAAAGRAIDQGFNRLVYTRMFLATMKPKALAKWQQHPGLFDRDKLAAARTLYEFDDAFTAPLHGYRDTPDYWARASSKPHLARLRIPALVLNARNDPFVPAASQGAFPSRVLAMPHAVSDWLAEHG